MKIDINTKYNIDDVVYGIDSECSINGSSNVFKGVFGSQFCSDDNRRYQFKITDISCNVSKFYRGALYTRICYTLLSLFNDNYFENQRDNVNERDIFSTLEDGEKELKRRKDANRAKDGW